VNGTRLDGGADTNRDRGAGLMNPTQVAEAQPLAREWDAAHPREPEALTLKRLPAGGRIGSDITSP